MPSRLADDREVKAIAATVGAAGRGTLMLVKGSKTSIDWIEDHAVESKRPVLVSAMRHHTASPNKVFEDTDALRNERETGRRRDGQWSCLSTWMDLSRHIPYPSGG